MMNQRKVMKSINLIKELLNYLGKLSISKIKVEQQNAAYEGTYFELNGHQYRSRLAKMTPKKKGYFVVFWEKDDKNQNQPYEFADSPDKLIISVIDGHLQGQFIFPKSILLEKGILSGPNQTGKMATRVYPIWVKDLNPSAQKTQNWQVPYFIDLSSEVDCHILKTLYYS